MLAIRKPTLHISHVGYRIANMRPNVLTSGFSLVEIVLAGALFALITMGVVSAYLYGEETTTLAGARNRAVLLADEGVEAARSMRDASYTNLMAGVHGLATSSNKWAFSGAQDVTGPFARALTLTATGTCRTLINESMH